MSFGLPASSVVAQQPYSAQNANYGPPPPPPGPGLAGQALVDMAQFVAKGEPASSPSDQRVKNDFIGVVQASTLPQGQRQQAALNQRLPMLIQDAVTQLQSYPQAASVLGNAINGHGSLDQATLERSLEAAAGNRIGPYTLKVFDMMVGAMAAQNAGPPRGGGPPQLRGGYTPAYGGGSSYGMYGARPGSSGKQV